MDALKKSGAIVASPGDMQREIESLRATISRLREYARHQPGCCWWTGTIYQPHPCDCGYDDLIKEIGG